MAAAAPTATRVINLFRWFIRCGSLEGRAVYRAGRLAPCRRSGSERSSLEASARLRISGRTPPVCRMSTSSVVSTAAAASKVSVLPLARWMVTATSARGASWSGRASTSIRSPGLSSQLRRMPLGRQPYRQDAHADEVRAVDALEADGENRAHAEKRRAFSGPVARRSGAVAFAGDEDDGRALVAVALGSTPQRQHFAAWRVDGRAGRRRGVKLVPRCAVHEQAAQHDFPVAATRREHVEVAAILAARHEVVGGVAARRDLPGRRDVIGRDVVAEHDQRMGHVTAEARLRPGRRERRAADVGRRFVPREDRRRRHVELRSRRRLPPRLRRRSA